MQDWKGSDVGLPWANIPEDVGISSSGLSRIDRWIEQAVNGTHNLPMGACLIARKGRVVYYKGCGEANPGNEIKSNSLYRIYSMTKPITSVALMMLWEEGRLLLDDPVHLYLGDKWKKENMRVLESYDEPDGPCTKTMRIRHLLTHTSGLTYGFVGNEKLNPVDAIYQESNRVAIKKNETLAELVDRIATFPLCHQPGMAWNYSYATDVVGRLVEVISGKDLETFLTEKILKPLGMNDTFFFVGEENAHRFVNIHFDHEESGNKIDVTHLQQKHQEYTRAKNMHSGGGGLVSTVKDYARFSQFCLNGGVLDDVRLLGRKTFEFMTMNHLPKHLSVADLTTPSSAYMAPPGQGFGLGFAVINERKEGSLGYAGIASSGSHFWGGAASTIFWIDPKEQLFVLFYTQVLALDQLKLPLRTYIENLVYSCLCDGSTHYPKL